MTLKGKNLNYKGILSVPEFSLKESVFSVLLGQNGSGKSTFLRALAGLNPALSSSVFLNGKALQSWPPLWKAQKILWLPAELSHGLSYTVEEVALLGLYPWGTDSTKKEDKERLYSILEELSLQGKADRVYSTLSSGERKLTDLARVFLGKGDIFLLDEPTSHLDLKKASLVFSLLRKKVEKEGKTVLISSHNLELSKKMAHEIHFMKEGSLLMEKTFQKLPFEEKVRETFDLPASFF